MSADHETPSTTLSWFKTIAILGVTGAAALSLPDEPIDPWKLVDAKKVAVVIFALALLQTLASVVVRSLGKKAGVLILGFLAGLVSSTATTAAIAKQSQSSGDDDLPAETATLLAATLAMLCEAVVVLGLTLNKAEPILYLMFVGPVLMTFALTIWMSRKVKTVPPFLKDRELEIIPLLKLTAFIVGILALSKWAQGSLGDQGLMLLTFVISLFEIHGSIIANIQLANSEAVTHQTLALLFTLSVVASFVSKLGLIYAMGSWDLKKRITWLTAILLIAQGASFFAVKTYLAAS